MRLLINLLQCEPMKIQFKYLGLKSLYAKNIESFLFFLYFHSLILPGYFLLSNLFNFSFVLNLLPSKLQLTSLKTSLLFLLSPSLACSQSYSPYLFCWILAWISAILCFSSFCSDIQCSWCSCNLRFDSARQEEEEGVFGIERVWLRRRVWVWFAKKWKSRPLPLRCKAWEFWGCGGD